MIAPTPIKDEALLDAIQEIMDQNVKDADELMRKMRVRRRIISTMIKLFSVLFAVVMATVLVRMYWPLVVTDYDRASIETRKCIFKVGERTVQGTRSYDYRYMTVLGHRIYMTKDVDIAQETRLDISGNGMTIVLQKAGEESKTKIIGDGEKFRQLLEQADSYTFFMDGGKNTAVISYGDLCK